MTTPEYAVAADLAASPWNLVVSAEDAASLLGYATRLIRRATLTAVYVPDPETGLPTDDRLKTAFKEATCSQVATWVKLSADPALGAADAGKTIAAKSRGSASIQYVAYASTVLARAELTTKLAGDARGILLEAGLLADGPVSY